MACLHFSPKLLETNGNFKGAIPLASHFSEFAPRPIFFFFGGGKIKSFKMFIFETKNC